MEIWKNLQHDYLHHVLARQYLDIVIASTIAESWCFLKGGNTIWKRNLLSGKQLPELQFLNALSKRYWN